MSLKHRLFLWTQSNLNLEIRRRLRYLRSSHQRCSMKKGVLRNFAKFTGKHLCQSNYIKKETLAQVFSCEFCGLSKNTFFAEQLKATASVYEYLIQETLSTLYLNPLNANPTNGQTHSNNSSAVSRRIVWMCLTILWDWGLKG